MNHVINLAVQDFIKNIKELMSDDMDEGDLDSEDDNENSDNPLSEEFALAIWKIKELMKI